MRITLDIDDDILQTAKELAAREGSTVGQAISNLSRRGLTAASTRHRKNPVTRGGVPLLPSRGEVITLGHIQYLQDSEGI